MGSVVRILAAVTPVEVAAVRDDLASAGVDLVEVFTSDPGVIGPSAVEIVLGDDVGPEVEGMIRGRALAAITRTREASAGGAVVDRLDRIEAKLDELLAAVRSDPGLVQVSATQERARVATT